jgi:hypothetical protein
MWIASALMVLVVAYRIFTGTHDGYYNFAPLMAVAFCGGIYLSRKMAWLLPLGILLASDLILNNYYGIPLFSPFMALTYFCYAVAIGFGIWVSQRKSLPLIFGGVLANAFLFYVVTNTGSWLTNPAYATGFSGWWQALTVGMPGFPPTILFFRNSLAGDLIFTVAFVLCMEGAARWAGQPSLLRRLRCSAA